jgi:hypothetical protein
MGVLMPTKICRACGSSQPLGDFYRHPQMADGHLNFCKTCISVRGRKRREENADAYRAMSRAAYAATAQGRRNYQRLYKRQHPDRRRATNLVYKAIKRGKLTRQPCEVCAAPRAEAHHEDYSQPFKIRWLCRLHHMRAHHPLPVQEYSFTNAL